ncbi:MAG: WYL domain-containing protein, partial [Oscillospiraceae bacterium]|nr:WYL domain-containing protein [Oscillospiraceae bacterium]
LNAAINRGRRVSFRYYHYGADKRRKLKNGGKPYVLSPYTLTWNGDNYYVVGWSDKHGKIAVFRVDRIHDVPEILDIPAARRPKGFSVGRFTEKAFCMFETDHETVSLLCDNDMMNTVIDHFGIRVRPVYPDPEHFRIDVEVSVSPTFFSWVFEFAPGIRILGPEKVRRAYRRHLRRAAGT